MANGSIIKKHNTQAIMLTKILIAFNTHPLNWYSG